MFRVGEYTIRFRRYGTGLEVTACVVTFNGVDHNGMTTLHPKDQANKITGKKIALARALSQAFTKAQRTEIWDAFWEYIQSWGVKEY